MDGGRSQSCGRSVALRESQVLRSAVERRRRGALNHRVAQRARSTTVAVATATMKQTTIVGPAYNACVRRVDVRTTSFAKQLVPTSASYRGITHALARRTAIAVHRTRLRGALIQFVVASLGRRRVFVCRPDACRSSHPSSALWVG